MAYPQDDPTGLTRIPQLADTLLANGLASGFGFPASHDAGDTINLAPTAQLTSDDLMQRVIDLGGRTNIKMYLDSSSGGLIFHADIGKAIGTYFAARYLQAIEGFVDNIQIPEPAEDATTVQEPVEKQHGNQAWMSKIRTPPPTLIYDGLSLYSPPVRLEHIDRREIDSYQRPSVPIAG